MGDITNHKTLREYCNSIKCEIWIGIKKLEEEKPKTEYRNTLRLHCSRECGAYKLVKWLETGNFTITRNKGESQYK